MLYCVLYILQHTLGSLDDYVDKVLTEVEQLAEHLATCCYAGMVHGAHSGYNQGGQAGYPAGYAHGHGGHGYGHGGKKFKGGKHGFMGGHKHKGYGRK
jgi:hypothetical protein